MAGAVSTTTLISSAWQNIYDLVETVTDPLSRGTANQWIFSAFPQSRKGTTSIFPCIIIESPNMVGENIIFGHSKRDYTWNFDISVYATKMQHCDQVIDSIIGTLETQKASLETNGLYQLNFTSSPTFHSVIGGNVVHEKRVTVQAEGMI